MTAQSRVILGVWDGHDAGAALCVDGVLCAAVSEERFSRIKKQGGWPWRAIAAVLEQVGVDAGAVDSVAVAGALGRLPARLFDRRYGARPPQSEDPTSWPAQLYARYQNGPAGWRAGRWLERAGSAALVRAKLASAGMDAPVVLVDHHLAHATTAVAALSPGEDALIATMDGYGDSTSAAIWRWSEREAKLHCLQRQGWGASLALLYGRVNAALGFAPGEEGKVTGLAAQAGLRDTLALTQLVGAKRGRLHVDDRAATRVLVQALRATADKRLVAASLQRAVQQAAVDMVTWWLAETGLRRLSVAGGLFGNVSINGALAALELEQFAVFGAMGDAGLCAGAAWHLAGQRPTLRSMRLGPLPGHLAGGEPVSAAEVGRLLAGGALVAVSRGPLEFGPRALCGRSLLFDARLQGRARTLGEALSRPSFMPFAPVLREADWPRLFDICRSRVRRCSAEMTIALPTRAAQLLPAAVADDGTARPQAIGEAEDPWMHRVLAAFSAHGGGVALVNTSLNQHREPICCTAEQSLRAARSAGADALVCADRLYPLRPQQLREARAAQ